MEINILDRYLPLGSIVILNGSVKKMLITARGLIAPVNGEKKAFDYGGIFYPEGVMGEKMAFFNQEDIYKVVFEGFSDADDDAMNDNIKNWLLKVKDEETAKQN